MSTFHNPATCLEAGLFLDGFGFFAARADMLGEAELFDDSAASTNVTINRSEVLLYSRYGAAAVVSKHILAGDRLIMDLMCNS